MSQMNFKTTARYFLGLALVMEGVCMSTNSGYYPKMYWYPLKDLLGESAIVHLVMACITSILLGAGALTLANNPTGFYLSIIGFIIQIIVIYGPKVYMSSDSKERREHFIEIGKAGVGILMAINLMSRQQRILHIKGKDDVVKLKAILSASNQY